MVPEKYCQWNEEVAQNGLQERCSSIRKGGEHHHDSIQSVKETDENELPLRKLEVILGNGKLFTHGVGALTHRARANGAEDRQHESNNPEYDDEREGCETQHEERIHGH